MPIFGAPCGTHTDPDRLIPNKPWDDRCCCPGIKCCVPLHVSITSNGWVGTSVGDLVGPPNSIQSSYGYAEWSGNPKIPNLDTYFSTAPGTSFLTVRNCDTLDGLADNGATAYWWPRIHVYGSDEGDCNGPSKCYPPPINCSSINIDNWCDEPGISGMCEPPATGPSYTIPIYDERATATENFYTINVVPPKCWHRVDGGIGLLFDEDRNVPVQAFKYRGKKYPELEYTINRQNLPSKEAEDGILLYEVFPKRWTYWLYDDDYGNPLIMMNMISEDVNGDGDPDIIGDYGGYLSVRGLNYETGFVVDQKCGPRNPPDGRRFPPVGDEYFQSLWCEADTNVAKPKLAPVMDPNSSGTGCVLSLSLKPNLFTRIHETLPGEMDTAGVRGSDCDVDLPYYCHDDVTYDGEGQPLSVTNLGAGDGVPNDHGTKYIWPNGWKVDSVDIINPGTGYSVGEYIKFKYFENPLRGGEAIMRPVCLGNKQVLTADGVICGWAQFGEDCCDSFYDPELGIEHAAKWIDEDGYTGESTENTIHNVFYQRAKITAVDSNGGIKSIRILPLTRTQYATSADALIGNEMQTSKKHKYYVSYGRILCHSKSIFYGGTEYSEGDTIEWNCKAPPAGQVKDLKTNTWSPLSTDPSNACVEDKKATGVIVDVDEYGAIQEWYIKGSDAWISNQSQDPEISIGQKLYPNSDIPCSILQYNCSSITSSGIGFIAISDVQPNDIGCSEQIASGTNGCECIEQGCCPEGCCDQPGWICCPDGEHCAESCDDCYTNGYVSESICPTGYSLILTDQGPICRKIIGEFATYPECTGSFVGKIGNCYCKPSVIEMTTTKCLPEPDPTAWTENILNQNGDPNDHRGRYYRDGYSLCEMVWTGSYPVRKAFYPTTIPTNIGNSVTASECYGTESTLAQIYEHAASLNINVGIGKWPFKKISNFHYEDIDNIDNYSMDKDTALATLFPLYPVHGTGYTLAQVEIPSNGILEGGNDSDIGGSITSVVVAQPGAGFAYTEYKHVEPILSNTLPAPFGGGTPASVIDYTFIEHSGYPKPNRTYWTAPDTIEDSHRYSWFEVSNITIDANNRGAGYVVDEIYEIYPEGSDPNNLELSSPTNCPNGSYYEGIYNRADFTPEGHFNWYINGYEYIDEPIPGSSGTRQRKVFHPGRSSKCKIKVNEVDENGGLLSIEILKELDEAGNPRTYSNGSFIRQGGLMYRVVSANYKKKHPDFYCYVSSSIGYGAKLETIIDTSLNGDGGLLSVNVVPNTEMTDPKNPSNTMPAGGRDYVMGDIGVLWEFDGNFGPGNLLAHWCRDNILLYSQPDKADWIVVYGNLPSFTPMSSLMSPYGCPNDTSPSGIDLLNHTYPLYISVGSIRFARVYLGGTIRYDINGYNDSCSEQETIGYSNCYITQPIEGFGQGYICSPQSFVTLRSRELQPFYDNTTQMTYYYYIYQTIITGMNMVIASEKDCNPTIEYNAGVP